MGIGIFMAPRVGEFGWGIYKISLLYSYLMLSTHTD